MSKKTILALVVILTMGFTFTSCKTDKADTKTDAKEEVKSETASNDGVVYQCPMDCEKGKSYTEAGKCPECNMDLKEHKAGETHEDHAEGTCEACGHDKADCTCPKDKKHADASCDKCGPDKECVCPKDEKGKA